MAPVAAVQVLTYISQKLKKAVIGVLFEIFFMKTKNTKMQIKLQKMFIIRELFSPIRISIRMYKCNTKCVDTQLIAYFIV